MHSRVLEIGRELRVLADAERTPEVRQREALLEAESAMIRREMHDVFYAGHEGFDD